MNILIRQAKIISSQSAHHNKTVDILIEGGTIAAIRRSIPAKGNVRIVEGKGLMVSAGWVDMQAVSCDPGFEHKEDLDTMIRCAAAGGFTAVCIHSYTHPALHNKSQIEYVLNKTQNRVVDVVPFGTITLEGKGKDMAEMYDMKLSGAAGFSDYKHAIKDAGMVMRALQYSTNIGSFIITHCNDESVSVGGQINEGEVSTALGLKGLPGLAEEIMVQRNISILEYAGGRMHIPTISTRGSVELIRKAKASGLDVTCGVAAANLFLDDSSLKEFDTDYKEDPPLRTKRDVQSLRHAVENGTIDVIVSDHLPQDVESKELEFDLADFGIINLQTAFSCALEGLKPEGLESIVKAFAENPRAILGLEQVIVGEGERANLTIFSTEQTTTLTEMSNQSKSRNSPFLNTSLKGRIIGVINGTKTAFN
jgi:dihydroorotase